jgi:hypothetical protein
MPVFKISTLTTATAVSATNQFEINQNGASRSATLSQVVGLVTPAVIGAAPVSAPVFTGTVAASGDLQFNSGYGSAVTAYGCRAWVNFNGTGTIAIRGSGNVSSITDGGIGRYRVNFTTVMPDGNYSCGAMVTQDGSDNTILTIEGTNTAVSTTGLFIIARTLTNSSVDRTTVMFEAFR